MASLCQKASKIIQAQPMDDPLEIQPNVFWPKIDPISNLFLKLLSEVLLRLVEGY